MLHRFLKNSCEPRAASYEQSRFRFARSSRPEARSFRSYQTAKSRNRSRGYILITMMLFMSLLAMAALAVLPDIALQIKRDREEELIHRGLGYSRGIRRFYKKFGRYPTKIEELENTNTLRFIRKRYKDPVTGEDFKILRVGDVGLSGSMAGGIPGQNLPGAPGVTLPSRGTPGSNLGQGTGQQLQIVTNTDTTNAAVGDSGTSPNTQVSPNSSGSSSSSTSTDTSSSTQQVFGGGPMVGVVSTNKAKTIREFCKKSHYKDWYFIYDPSSDRGGAMNSPWCPGLGNQGFGANPLQPTGAQVPRNAGSPPGGVPPTQNPPNPGGQMPPEQ
jgi:type II secretory pathway pseudopilin PulG